MKKTECKENWQELCNYLEEDFDSVICQDLKDHLEECPDCKENVESIRSTVDMYRKSNPDVPLSQEMKKKLINQLKKTD
ncbi:hypothetical protein IIC38_04345 [candidate division KSB1 bacterium]|nr:hypothetical protein [candidate division KSB1 bacterium]